MKMNEGPAVGASSDATPAANHSSRSSHDEPISRVVQPKTGHFEVAEQHHKMLADSAISEEVYLAADTRSVLCPEELPEECNEWSDLVPGLLFARESVEGRRSWQFRPDTPPVRKKRPKKYLTLAGEPQVMTVHPWMRQFLTNPAMPLVIIEGTKQYLAAVSVLGQTSAYAAIGMSGCWGWSTDQALSPDLQAIPVQGRSVIVVMDADISTNPRVYDAAQRLADSLVKLRGAREVKFVHLPGTGTAGLDDVLAGIEEVERSASLVNLLASATASLGRRPKRKSNPFMSEAGPLVKDLAEDICEKNDLAIGIDNDIWFYRDGVYLHDPEFIAGQVTRRLENSHRSSLVASVTQIAKEILRDHGRVIPDNSNSRWLNVANGMLDPLTEKLRPHSPDDLSVTQIPVEWDPETRAPKYEAWLAERVGDQMQDLEESVSMMLDPGRIPQKAILLYGPSRSGKSTFQRIAAEIAGKRNVSSVTLHNLSNNRFASAHLVGKLLNTAADLSAQHVEDLANFKMATGGDLMLAERKGQQGFEFTNRAMMLFSANTIPSVGESSTAYLERMKPFEFGLSFAGAEDPTIEEKMLDELPGILVRWVKALQVRRHRGMFLPTRSDIAGTFAVNSDAVRMFLDEKTVPDSKGTTRTTLYSEYKEWAEESGYKKMSSRKFYERVRSAGVDERRDRALGNCFLVRIYDPGAPMIPGDPEPPLRRLPEGEERDSCDSCDSCDSFPPLPPPPETSSSKETLLRSECSETVTTVTEGNKDGNTAFSCGADVVVLSETVTDSVPSVPTGVSTRYLGHGILTAQLPALCEQTGLSPLDLAARCHDLLLLARLDDPTPGGTRPRTAAARHSLEALATKHGLAWSNDSVVQEKSVRELVERYPMTPYARREHRVMGIVGQMRLTGFSVDETRLDELLAAEATRRQELVDALALDGLPLRTKDGAVARDPLNTEPGRAFLQQRLQELGVDIGRKASGEWALSKDTLTQIIDNLPGSHPGREFALRVIEARTGQSSLGQVRDCARDGRVHPFVDASQATGRFSITQPGLTIMRKNYGRDAFLPDPGHVIISADLSQIDARAVAAHCQDPEYLALFEDGRDFHTEVAQRVLGGAEHRSIAKVLNHATSYGAGAGLIAKTARIDIQDARRFLDDMERAYSVWASWRRDVVSRAKQGALLDNGFGRKVRANPERLETTPVAMIGQSCARDLLAECLLRLDDAGLTPNLRMMIHDEVVLSVPEAEVKEYRETVRDCMTFEWAPRPGDTPVPIRATVSSPGRSWADGAR